MQIGSPVVLCVSLSVCSERSKPHIMFLAT